jgi:predicted Zn-dependent peptidase
MKNFNKYTLLVVVFVFATSFTSFQPEDKAKEFTVNGLKVILKPSIKEIISVRFFIKGGTANYTKEQEGIESLALAVAVEGGTKQLNKTEFATAAEKIGTSIGFSTSYDYSEISMSCVSEFWDPSWKLFADVITQPRFEGKEFELIKAQAVSQAKQAEANPDVHLRNRSMEVAFSKHNYSKIPAGTKESLEKLSLENVVSHFKSIIGKQNCFLVVMGNITEGDLKERVATAFASLPSGKKPILEPRLELKPEATIENRDIATNYIRGIMSAPSVREKEGVPMMLAMAIMRDRFFVELRTKRGLTYAPNAGYTSTIVNNPYAIFYASSTDPKQTLQVMMQQINEVKNQGFKEKELKDMKETYLTDHFLGLETNDSQTMSLGLAEIAGDWSKTETFMNEVEKATIQDINNVFKKYSSSINWMYLGKETAVSKDDFKQPQMLPSAEKVSPKK